MAYQKVRYHLDGYNSFALNHFLEQARSHYEHALQLPGDSSGEHTVRLRLGEIYLSENDFAEAKDIYLRLDMINRKCFQLYIEVFSIH